MERLIKPGYFSDFNKVKFYNGEKVLAFGNPNHSRIILPEDWKEKIDIAYDWAVNERAEGFLIDDTNTRNARKVNLTKDDVFRIAEKDSMGDRLLNLYVPAKITSLGTVEKDRDKFGHSIYNRYKIEAPLQCSCGVVRDIGKEAWDKLYTSAKLVHGKYFHDEAGRDCTLIHREAKPDLDVEEAYLMLIIFPFTAPCFYHDEYVETIHNEYHDKCKKMSNKILELTGEQLTCYEIDKILGFYDITEKKQEE